MMEIKCSTRKLFSCSKEVEEKLRKHKSALLKMDLTEKKVEYV
jgi:hypothetical protein